MSNPTDKEIAHQILDNMPADITFKQIADRFMHILHASDLCTYLSKEGMIPSNQINIWVSKYIIETSRKQDNIC